MVALDKGFDSSDKVRAREFVKDYKEGHKKLEDLSKRLDALLKGPYKKDSPKTTL